MVRNVAWFCVKRVQMFTFYPRVVQIVNESVSFVGTKEVMGRLVRQTLRDAIPAISMSWMGELTSRPALCRSHSNPYDRLARVFSL